MLLEFFLQLLLLPEELGGDLRIGEGSIPDCLELAGLLLGLLLLGQSEQVLSALADVLSQHC